jgi:hypothetical protein
VAFCFHNGRVGFHVGAARDRRSLSPGREGFDTATACGVVKGFFGMGLQGWE